MRFIFFVASCILLAGTAQAQTEYPKGAESLFNTVMKGINPRHVSWVKKKATEVNAKNLTEAEVRTATTQYAVLGNMPEGDIEALAFLVLMQAAKSAQEDLKAIMSKVKAINNAKSKQRDLLAKMQENAMTPAELDSFTILSAKNRALVKGLKPDTVKLARSKGSIQQVKKADIDALVDKVKNDLDSMSEMGEMESLRLQMAMDRMSKMMSTLSNILKKISRTAEEITQNLK